MSTVGSLLIEIGANVARLQADLGKASRQVDSFVGGVSKTFRTLGIGIGGALSVAGIATFVKSAIDMADAIGKASEKFGVAVGPLSALKYAAELNEVAFEGLATGLKFLNKSMAEGDKAFGAMGIRVKDSSGNLRTTEDVLLDVAEAFASYKDGATKTALALQLFGKAGADMIPFLNQGKAGIREAMEEARRLGVVISTDTAKAADEFNDNLTRLKTSSSGLAVSLASEVLPLLQGMAEYMTDLVGSMQAANREFAKMKAETGQFIPDIEGVWSVPEASSLMSGSEDLVGRAGYEDMGRTPSKKGAPDILAWEKAAKEKQRLADEYTKLHTANMAREGEAVHETLGAEMGWTQEYHDTVRKLDDESFAGFKKGIEENAALLKKFNLDRIRGLEDLQNAQRAEMETEGPTTPYTFEDAMLAAEAYGNVSLAIQTMNSDLGATQAVLLENQSYIGLYKQAWLDANLAIVDSVQSLYSGMQGWISSSLQGLIEGTMRVQDVLKNLGKMMLRIITEYVAKWLVSRLFMAAMEAAFTAQQVATTTAAAAIIGAAWLEPAYLATVATLGGAAAEGVVALGLGIAAAQGLGMTMKGFEGTLGGGLSDTIAGGTGAAFASGTDFVPRTMPALVHKGERILTSEQNKDFTQFIKGDGPAGSGGGDVFLDGHLVGKWLERRADQYGGMKLRFT